MFQGPMNILELFDKYKITRNKFLNLHLHIRMIVKRFILLLKKRFFPLCYALENFKVIYWTKNSFYVLIANLLKKFCRKMSKILFQKQIFARWQPILSIFFYFDIEYIKSDTNFIPNFLTGEFLQNRSWCLTNPNPEIKAKPHK
jgi:hypothetical protein